MTFAIHQASELMLLQCLESTELIPHPPPLQTKQLLGFRGTGTLQNILNPLNYFKITALYLSKDSTWWQRKPHLVIQLHHPTLHSLFLYSIFCLKECWSFLLPSY